MCGLTNEYADFEGECNLFEPSEQQQEEIRANRVVARMKAMTRIGLSSYPYAFGIGVYFFIVACLGFTISEDYGPIITCLFLLSTGFVLAMVIGADYYFLRYKRKKKIFGELTSSAIEQIIKIEGFYPYKENGDIYFKSESIIYRIMHEAPKFSLLLQRPFQGYYKIALLAATKVMSNTIVGKIEVLELSGKSSQLFISFSVESLIHYVDELRVNFSSYFEIINIMHAQFLDEYHKLEEVEQAHNPLYDTTLIN